MIKIIKRLTWFLVPLMLLVASLARGEPVHAATTSSFELVLHKRLYTDVNAKVQPWYLNNGQKADAAGDIMTKTTGLNGVTFTVFDASALFQKAHGEGQDVQTFARQFSAMDSTSALAAVKADNLTKVAEVSTGHDDALDEDGIARLHLDRTRGDDPALYIVVETDTSKSGISVDQQRDTAPLVVSASMADQAGQKLNVVHMYPKNLVYGRDAYFFKYGVTLDGSEMRLAGAKFVLFKKNAAGDKLYLAAKQPDPLNLQWVAATNPKSDASVARFTSQKTGLVTLGGISLPAGNYEFAEVDAPEGFQNDAGEIKVNVPSRMYTASGKLIPVTVNDTELAQTSSGQVTAETIALGQPRVYNTEDQPPLPNTWFPPNPGTKSRTPNPPGKGRTHTPGHPLLPSTGIFPQLGDLGNWLLSCLGFVVMLLVLHFWKKREHSQA